jgi:hypothetical protein
VAFNPALGYLQDGSEYVAAPHVWLPRLKDATWNASKALRNGLGEDAGNRVLRGALSFLAYVDHDRAENILASIQSDIDPDRPMSSPAVVSLLLLGRGMYDIEDRRLDILRLGTANETSILQLEWAFFCAFLRQPSVWSSTDAPTGSK